MVYIWGFSYFDYSFDVQISRIGNLGLYNWFYHLYLLPFYLLMYVYAQDTVFITCYLTWIYQYTCDSPYTPLGIHHTTRWGVLTPLDMHVQISELGAYGFFWLLIRDAQRKHGSSADRLEPHPSSPCLSLEFSFYNSWASFILFIIVYFFVFSHLRLSVT